MLLPPAKQQLMRGAGRVDDARRTDAFPEAEFDDGMPLRSEIR
jgi:hypothetical protein